MARARVLAAVMLRPFPSKRPGTVPGAPRRGSRRTESVRQAGAQSQRARDHELLRGPPDPSLPDLLGAGRRDPGEHRPPGFVIHRAPVVWVDQREVPELASLVDVG